MDMEKQMGSKKSAPAEAPAKSLEMQVDGGRVEVSVVDGSIWLSSYEGKTHQFTIVVPRKPLQGNQDACDAVAQHARKGCGRDKSAMVTAAIPKLQATPPAKAGYWYEDPNFPTHGGPVVIIEE